MQINAFKKVKYTPLCDDHRIYGISLKKNIVWGHILIILKPSKLPWVYQFSVIYNRSFKFYI